MLSASQEEHEDMFWEGIWLFGNRRFAPAVSFGRIYEMKMKSKSMFRLGSPRQYPIKEIEMCKLAYDTRRLLMRYCIRNHITFRP